MNYLMKLFSSIEFPFFHFRRGTLSLFQFSFVGGDGYTHTKYAKVLYLVILFLVLHPFMIELSFAGIAEIPNEITHSQVMLREFAYNEDVKGSLSGFELLEVEREGLGKFCIGRPEFLPVVSLPLNDGFNQFSAKVAEQSDNGNRNANRFDRLATDIIHIVSHEPLAFAVLLLIVSYWLADIL